MYKNLRAKDGRKLYAVCRWEPNQHKIYNAYDRAYIALYEANTAKEIESAQKRLDEADAAIQWIDNVKDDGLVYAPWEVRELIRRKIGAYDIRH